MAYIRKSRRVEGVGDCSLHPDRNSGLKPSDGCLICLANYGRAQLKRRVTMRKNGGYTTHRGDRGQCGVCKVKNVKLSGTKLECGDMLCETCEDVWQGADIRASSLEGIRGDMTRTRVPLRVDIGG